MGFWVLATMNNAEMNIHVNSFMRIYVANSIGYILRNRIAGSYHNSFWGTTRLFSKVVALSYIPTSNVGGSNFSNIFYDVKYKSPVSMLEMRILRLFPRRTESSNHCCKPPGWFWYMLTFENYWSRANISFDQSLWKNSYGPERCWVYSIWRFNAETGITVLSVLRVKWIWWVNCWHLTVQESGKGENGSDFWAPNKLRKPTSISSYSGIFVTPITFRRESKFYKITFQTLY